MGAMFVLLRLYPVSSSCPKTLLAFRYPFETGFPSRRPEDFTCFMSCSGEVGLLEAGPVISSLSVIRIIVERPKMKS